MAKAEQINKRTPPSKKSKMRKDAKKRAARLRRRAEKIDVENAPSRLTKGWAD